MTGYYKAASNSTGQIKDLKKNELELIKQFSSKLSLDEELCAQLYKDYLASTFNQFHVNEQLAEKIDTNELASIHFDKFVTFYYRERFAFLKILIVIASVTGDNVEPYLETNQSIIPIIKDLFSKDDLKQMFKPVLNDYVTLCKKIKVSQHGPSNINLLSEQFLHDSLIQSVDELELVLELMLILSSVSKLSLQGFYDVSTEFSKYAIVKWLSTSKVASQLSSNTLILEQISYLQVLIVVKLTKLEKEVLGKALCLINIIFRLSLSLTK